MASTTVVWNVDPLALISAGLIIIGATLLIALFSWHLVGKASSARDDSRRTLGFIIALELLGVGLLMITKSLALYAGVLSMGLGLILFVRKFWQKRDGFSFPSFVPLGRPPYRSVILVSVTLLALLVVPGLLFPTQRALLTLLSAVLVVLVWLTLYLWPSGGPWSPGKQDLALVLTLIAVVIAAILGGDNELTLSKIAGIVVGLAAYSVVLLFRGEKQLKVLVGLYLAAGAIFAIVGFFFVKEPHQSSIMAILYSHLPHIIEKLPEALGGAANQNQLAGTLLFLMPVALSLSVVPSYGNKMGALRIVALVSTLLMSITLVLTQSRSGWAGASVSALVVFMVRWRWLRKTVIWALIISGLLFLIFVPLDVVHEIANVLLSGQTFSTPLGDWNLHSRPIVWAQALDEIQKSPWLGNGLGTFRNYVEIDKGTYSAIMPHAHNLVLQLVYDLGLLGTSAFLAFCGIILWQGIRVAQRGRGWLSGLGGGVVAVLAGFGVYGIADTIALGAKTGVFFWILAGLIQVAYQSSASESSGSVEG